MTSMNKNPLQTGHKHVDFASLNMFYQETDFPGLIRLIATSAKSGFATYFWVITLNLALTLTLANSRILAFRSSNPLSMIALSMKPMSASVTHRKVKTCIWAWCLEFCFRHDSWFPVLFYYFYNTRRIRKYLPRRSNKTLIHAFVSSCVDYCKSLLYGLLAYQLNKL